MRFWRDVGEAMMEAFQAQGDEDYSALTFRRIFGQRMPLHPMVYDR